VTGYGLHDRGSVPGRGRKVIWSHRPCVQTGSEAQETSYSNCTGDIFPGSKVAGARS